MWIGYFNHKSRNISVGTAMGYGLDGRISVPGMGKKYFPSQYPDRL
jgi:hypothetical protein